MFTINKFTERSLEIIEVSDGQGTAARFVPARGGILTQFTSRHVHMFYLDEETVFDESKNIRGGNPVLFPICGPLEDGCYTVDDRQYRMSQHGVARMRPWELVETTCGADSAVVKLALRADKVTLESFPFDFELEFTYTVQPGAVTIHQRYINHGTGAMPFYAGFHPYFRAPGPTARDIDIPSRRYYDLKEGTEHEYEGHIDLAARPETNLVFGELGANRAGFITADGHRVTVRFDDNFRYIVLWSLMDREFLCVEPWMGDNYDLNRGRSRFLPPGETLTAVVSYEIVHGG